MKVGSISIAACIWQNGRFDPVLRKDETGLWAFPSECFEMKTDDDFARQSLERGLHKLFNGTLNSMNLTRSGFNCKFKLASDRSYAVATAPSGMGLARSGEPVHLFIVVPLFEVTGVLREQGLPHTQFHSQVQQREARMHTMVSRTLNANGKDWQRLVAGKNYIPMRQNFGFLAGQLKRMAVPENIINRLTQPHTEDYWHPPPEGLQSVA
ncbi:MAG: hypothetical protein DI628_02650 [Blastochloris viridis]|uniref:Uncharacterized protein n=1 Tax=Blastochloris viridis TaxID=1079 RepID=A0A6N4R8V1_BLAVI|nr:MAG: hypothetical protein DI628_02650 [Blastochloris viridis]